MRNVGSALRTAVLAALAACGGKTDGGSDASTSCTVTPPNPVPTASCASYTIAISGAAQCAIGDGGPTTGQCASLCPTGTQACVLSSDTSVQCMAFCGKARTSMRRRSRGTPLESYLRDSVWLESASIDAFETLACELRAHGAPATLVREARRAARDEARHTRATAAVAKRHGVTARVAKTRRRVAVRALVDVAIENAVEGCVHETYGAALARFQSLRASDARDRDAMREIARDEARHATLARRVARWANRKLTATQRERVARASDEAISRLVRSLRAEPPADLVTKLAVPTAAQSLAMADALRATLW